MYSENEDKIENYEICTYHIVQEGDELLEEELIRFIVRPFTRTATPVMDQF